VTRAGFVFSSRAGGASLCSATCANRGAGSTCARGSRTASCRSPRYSSARSRTTGSIAADGLLFCRDGSIAIDVQGSVNFSRSISARTRCGARAGHRIGSSVNSGTSRGVNRSTSCSVHRGVSGLSIGHRRERKGQGCCQSQTRNALHDLLQESSSHPRHPNGEVTRKLLAIDLNGGSGWFTSSAMTHVPADPDPYAELDYRSDAGELSEEFRKPAKVRQLKRLSVRQRPR
jgi:hypothetical protein